MKGIKILKKGDFKKWLQKNSEKEEKVSIILQKKHTGNYAPTHREQMNTAICFGWIDTTVKKSDKNTYIRNFSKRNRNSSWSINTLSYGKKLLKENKMSKQGIKFYELGVKKGAFDFGIPKNPEMPTELKNIIFKNKKVYRVFEKFSPSIKKTLYRNILLAKLPATRNKRALKIVEEVKNALTKK